MTKFEASSRQETYAKSTRDFFLKSDEKCINPFNSLKDAVQFALDNNKPVEIMEHFKSKYSETTTVVPQYIIKQYLKFMRKRT